MRILALAPLLILGACNVSTDNNSLTVEYDQNTAENVASDVGNTAENIGDAISNDVEDTGNKIDNSSIIADDEQNQATNTTTNEQ
jgi:hypothetical protein